MERFHLLIKGKVQGVGFRYFCQYQATLNSITGLARNLENGDVELEIQGNSSNIDKFINTILKGNGFSKIIDFKKDSIPLIENDKKFKITY